MRAQDVPGGCVSQTAENRSRHRGREDNNPAAAIHYRGIGVEEGTIRPLISEAESAFSTMTALLFLAFGLELLICGGFSLS